MTIARKCLLLGLVLAAGLFLSGCASPTKPPLYYYGSYQKTLYKVKKDPTPDNLSKHRACLEDIITVSRQRNLRVPPGIHCEYGYMLWQKGERTAAEEQFNLETQTYPESEVFVTLVRKMLQHEPSP